MSAHPAGFSAADMHRNSAIGYTTLGITLAAAAYDVLQPFSDALGVPALGVAGMNTDSDITVAVATDRFTVSKRGLYKVEFKSNLNLGGAGTFTFQFRVNATAPVAPNIYDTQVVTGGLATDVPVALDAMLYLHPGDFVEVWKNSDAGAGALACNCNCSIFSISGPWN